MDFMNISAKQTKFFIPILSSQLDVRNCKDIQKQFTDNEGLKFNKH